MLATLLAASLVAGTALQDLPLPTPTGVHPVGVISRTLIDSTRSDSSGPAPSSRSVNLLVWYPAERDSGEPAPYVEDLGAEAGELGALHARVRPNARRRAAFVRDVARAAVVVLAPGRVAAGFDYTSLSEDLASHGYVVVAVTSPGHSKIFRPDGTIQPVRFGPMPPSSYPNRFDELQEPMNRLISADLLFVSRQLAVLNAGDPVLRGRLDLAAVGMMGHSNGAMAGSRACASDERCRAFLGIEGSQTREIRQAGNAKPFGLVYSEQTLAFDTLGVFTSMRDRARAPFSLYRVAQAGHNSFTDLLLIRPTLFNYPLEAVRGVAITRAIVRGFFDTHLKGIANGDSIAAAMPEVRIERFPQGRTPPPTD